MSEGDEDEIDELREQTRGTDRISADAGDGGSESRGGEAGVKEDEKTEEREKRQNDAEREAMEEDSEKDIETGADSHDTPTPSEEFERAFEERAGRTSSGIDPRTVSATDPALSAFLLALQDAGELDDVGGAIADELGAPAPPEYDRDALVRLAVAYALEDAAPEYFGALAERA
jgi:hypothetical protein